MLAAEMSGFLESQTFTPFDRRWHWPIQKANALKRGHIKIGKCGNSLKNKKLKVVTTLEMAMEVYVS